MMLPPFPVDDQTLDLIEESLECGEDKPSTDLYALLQFFSEMAGSDITAIEQTEDGIATLRCPQYSAGDLILALVAEIRRLRSPVRL